jgi:DNA-binding MarR family transcriptional regulator
VQRGQSKEDKRETLVSLTESGISMIDKARKLIERVTNDIININEEEGHLINELLEKIRQSSDK